MESNEELIKMIEEFCKSASQGKPQPRIYYVPKQFDDVLNAVLKEMYEGDKSP